MDDTQVAQGWYTGGAGVAQRWRRGGTEVAQGGARETPKQLFFKR